MAPKRYLISAKDCLESQNTTPRAIQEPGPCETMACMGWMQPGPPQKLALQKSTLGILALQTGRGIS